jgi:hypothetical protein
MQYKVSVAAQVSSAVFDRCRCIEHRRIVDNDVMGNEFAAHDASD